MIKRSALDKFLQFFSSLKCGLILLGLVGVAVTLGTLILQRPMAREGQIEQIYAPQTLRLLNTLGLFDVFHTWWFILLLGLLGANIVLASIERFPQVWRLFARPHWLADEDFVRAQAFHREIPLGAHAPEEALALASRKLLGLGYSVRPESLRQGTLYIEKYRLARLAPYLVHTSLLLIFAGAIVDGTWGYRGFVNLGPGMRVQNTEPLSAQGAPRPLGFTVRCDAAGMDKYPDGTPRQYWSRLAIEEGGREVLSKQIYVNDPLTYKGVRFFQASYASSGAPGKLELDAAWTEGGATRHQTVVLQPGQASPLGDQGAQVELVDLLPDFVLQGNEVSSRSDEPRNPAIHLRVTQPDGRQASVWFFPKAPEMKAANDSGFTFQLRNLEMQYTTGLEVAHEPGQWLIWGGCLLLTGGLMLALYFAHFRIWGVVGRDPKRRDRRVLVLGGQTNKFREGFARRFDELAAALESELRSSEAPVAEPIPA
ncbi:MAG: cytochrome c biogenesis protein ResB [Acidobacteriia bacterium]|nr:cytochrome c biogenesis protein ResB [Terriglobia bacterium]